MSGLKPLPMCSCISCCIALRMVAFIPTPMYTPMPPPLPFCECTTSHMCCHIACWKGVCPTALPVSTIVYYGMRGEVPYSSAAPVRALALNPNHVVGNVHPAARTAASITTDNVPAKNDFFMANPHKYLITMLALHSS